MENTTLYYMCAVQWRCAVHSGLSSVQWMAVTLYGGPTEYFEYSQGYHEHSEGQP